MRKWLPLLPVALALGLTALAYGDLPPLVQPGWEYILPVGAAAANETMPREVFMVLIPGLAIAVWALLAQLARVRRAAILPDWLAAAAVERFEPTYHIVVLGVVGLLALMHIMLLAGAAGWPPWTFNAVGVTLGAGLFAVGNLMPRVRPNWIVGVRTRATLTDPQLWLRTHRYFGGLLMLAGIAVAIVALTAPRFAIATLAVGILVAAAAAHLWAAKKKPTAAAVLAGLIAALLTSPAPAPPTELVPALVGWLRAR